MSDQLKTIFDPAERNQLIARIQTLTGREQAGWGKMNVAQMVEHCIRWEETMAGERKIDRVWLGYLFGKIALKGLIGDDKPLRQGTPTLKELIIKEAPENFDHQKEKWINFLKGYEQAGVAAFIHPFCGKMTREQTGRMAYKHTDHHLRQFGR